MLKIAIIGRPNVGKSTLFNRLVGKRVAIVDKMPGVTRDRREGIASLFDIEFMIVDTAGIEINTKDGIILSMMKQTNYAMESSDVIVFMIDGREGIRAEDDSFSKIVRETDKKVVLVVNKCEGSIDRIDELYKFGFGEPIYISAEHNMGMEDLYEVFLPLTLQYVAEYEELKSSTDMQITVVGRPNAGKSTLVNHLLQEDRVITGATPGLTRDSIYVNFSYKDKNLILVDTAGIRRRKTSREKIEGLSVVNAMHSIKFSHVVILLFDATAAFEQQDLAIAKYIIEEGRCLVVVINKWDKVRNKELYLKWIDHNLAKKLTSVSGLDIMKISALNGDGCDSLIKKCFQMYDKWNVRISTGRLNKWLHQAVVEFPPALSHNKRRIKIKYITQINTRPPTFLAHVNIPEDMEESYKRYLVNSIRETFDLGGIPIRLMTKKNYNPYVTNEKKDGGRPNKSRPHTRHHRSTSKY